METQASLSNLTGAGSAVVVVAEDGGADGEEDGAGAVPLLAFAAAGFGWPKKAVMGAFALCFFAASVARSAALRLSDILVLNSNSNSLLEPEVDILWSNFKRPES